MLVWMTAGSLAQVDSTRIDSVQTDSAAVNSARIDTAVSGADTLSADTTQARFADFEFKPWQDDIPMGYRQVSNDSLLRWLLWADLVEFQNRWPGVISYRLGGLGRQHALQINGHDPGYQQLSWQGIPMNDPVSGGIKWNQVPHHKIKSIEQRVEGIEYQADFSLKKHHVLKPKSRIHYDEGKHNYRSMEFLITQNVTKKTNVEISYWDRRDGESYERDQYQGRQIYSRVTHELDSSRQLNLAFLHNGADLEQSYGYRLTQIFNRFSASPFEGNANSEDRQSILRLDYKKRQKQSGHYTLRSSLYYTFNRQLTSYSLDTTESRARSVGGFIQAAKKWGALDISGSANLAFMDLSGISLSNRSGMDANATFGVSYRPVDWATIRLIGETDYAFDRWAEKVTAGVTAEVGLLEADLWGAFGYELPTLQQRYWESRTIETTTQLSNAYVEAGGGRLQLSADNRWKIGAEASVKEIRNGIFLTGDSTYTNRETYLVLSGNAFAELNTRHWEVKTSVTGSMYETFFADRVIQRMTITDPAIWARGSVHWKGYVIDRAAYIKSGVYGMFSPMSYRPAYYQPELNSWQLSNSQVPLPWFYRVDVDLSARVRSIMVLMRLENALDGLGQAGYFETATYPMPGRRFMFGLRVVLTN